MRLIEWCRRSKDLEKAVEDFPKLADNLEERKKKYRVGFCSIWSPDALQVFRNPLSFTMLMFTYAILEGCLVSGLTSVVLSSIERRYKFTSTMTGLIASTFDITVVVCLVPVSYFGGKSHKPKWLGIGAIIHGIGAIVFSLPHFVGGSYLPSIRGSSVDYCESLEDISPSCGDSPSWVYFIFILGNILMGVGATPLFTVGTAFLDDISWPRKTSIYLGIYYTASVLGPAIGFGLGGALLTVFVDPGVDLSVLNLEESDPAYVGAWWLGFLLIGILVILISIPILMFPRELPEGELIKKERQKEMVLAFTDGCDDASLKGDLKDAPKHVLQVFSSPTWFMCTLSLALQAVSVVGIVSFGPKFLEVQYRVTSSVASFVGGGVGIAGAVIGTISGTVIIFFLKSTGKRAAFVVFLTSLISTLFAVGFLFSCPNAVVVGPQNNGSVGFISTIEPVGNLSCSQHCGCTTNIYTPVCDVVSGYTYFSPCHAGCPNTTEGDIYTNCTCASITGDGGYSPVIEGKCDNGCTYFAATIILLLLFLASAFMGEVPGLVVILRTVADEQRALSLGIQSVMFRVIGSIPGPLIFGAIFDSTCILWKYECSEQGNCWEYSNSNLTLHLFLVGLLTNAANTVFMFLGWIWYGRNWCFQKVKTSEHAKKSKLQPSSRDGRLQSSSSQVAFMEDRQLKTNGHVHMFTETAI
jgi:sodium-independent organic anion transporter